MRNKKKIYAIEGLMIMMILGLFSCNDGLADELFIKKSYIVRNGWQEYELAVASDNTAILPVYFGVNGTSGNDKNITLTLEVDPDTLNGYNWEKYKNQTSLYYQLLPEGTYAFDADSWMIPRGELKASAYITIDLNKIEKVGSLYNDYVLPLRISSSEGEPAGQSKYVKVLAHIGFKNDYSGVYSGKGVVTQQGTTYTTEITSTQIYAINNTTSYMFVGEKTRSNTENYLDYVVEIKQDELGNLFLSSAVEGLKFKPYSTKFSRKYTYNYNDQRYYTEITTIELAYEYLDSTQNEPLKMSFEGIFSMSKDVLRIDYPNVDIED